MNIKSLLNLRGYLYKAQDALREVHGLDDKDERLEPIQTHFKTIQSLMKLMIDDLHRVMQTYTEKDERLTKVVPNVECPNLNCKFSVPFTREDGNYMLFVCPQCRTHNSISLTIVRPEFKAFADAKMDAEQEDSLKRWRGEKS